MEAQGCFNDFLFTSGKQYNLEWRLSLNVESIHGLQYTAFQEKSVIEPTERGFNREWELLNAAGIKGR